MSVSRRFPAFLAFLLLAFSPVSAMANDAPEVMPTCWSPQPLSPPVVIANTQSNAPTLAWNGNEWGMLTVEQSRFRFRKVYADGTQSPAVVTLAVPSPSWFPSGDPVLVWNGSVFGAAFVVYESALAVNQVWFARLNRDGVTIGVPQRVSSVGSTPTWADDQPSLAWSPVAGTWAIAFRDHQFGASNTDIRVTLLDSLGNVNASGAAHDVGVSLAAGNQSNPKVGWNAASGSVFGVVWEDARVAPTQIYSNYFSWFDGSSGSELVMTTSTSGAIQPSLDASGSGYGLVWTDTRDGNQEIYFRRLTSALATTGSEIAVTSDSSISQAPAITWNGGEFGVAWTDYRSGAAELWFTRLTASGGGASPTQITDGYGASRSSVAFGRAVYVAASVQSSQLYTVTIGCNWDGSPPACPDDLQTLSTSGTSVTLGWSPVVDGETELSHYEIRREGATLLKTADTRGTITGLTPGTPFDLQVVAVDAAQRVSASCPAVAVTSLPVVGSCTTPRGLTTPRSTTSQVVRGQTAVVANSSDFATAWVDGNGRLYWQRLSPDGQPLSQPAQLATANASFSPGLAWNGNGYGIVWFSAGYFWFAVLDTNGVMQGTPTQVDVTATPDSSLYYWQAAVAWSGSRYCVVWFDSRNSGTTGRDVFTTLLTSSGAIAVNGTPLQGLPVANAAGDQTQPAVVWSAAIGQFIVAWEDDSASPSTIQTATLNQTTGAVGTPTTIVTPPSGGAARPSLAQTPGYLVVAWQDLRDPDGGGEIYATLLTASGTRWGWADQRISHDPSGSWNASVAHRSGSQFVIFWNDARDGAPRIYGRETYYGEPRGYESRLHDATDLHVPKGAAASFGMLVVGTDPVPAKPNGVIAVGCLDDATPPTCPTGLVAQTVTASEVRLTWFAGSDPDTGIAEYQVLRNGAEVGRTDEVSFTDLTVAPAATYQYQVIPWNWGGTSGTCTTTLSVTTPATATSCGASQIPQVAHVVGGTRVNVEAPILWNGEGYATLFIDAATDDLTFRKLWADGSPAAAPVVIDPSAIDFYIPSLVRDGSGYAAAWLSAADGRVHFAKLDSSGNVLLDVPVSVAQGWFIGYGRTALATSGSGFIVVFIDTSNWATNGFDIAFTLLDASGAIAGPSGAWHDLPLVTGTGNQLFPDVAWSGDNDRYVAVCEDGALTPQAIVSVRINPGTAAISTPASLGFPAAAFVPTLVGDGYNFGLVFLDNRNGCTDLWFVRLAASGSKLTTEKKINSVSCSNQVYEPYVGWTGTEYGVFWNDSAGDGNEAWYQRVLADGTLAGGNVQATDVGDTHRVTAAFGSRGWLVAGAPWAGGALGPLVASLMGCTVDATPPSCPGNILAYNVSTTQATVSWSPAGDPESGLAYYILYRNNAEILRTTSTVHTDTGLSAGNFNYMVQPVNARGVQNLACTQSVWVKTGSSLLLMVTEESLDALLAWDDGGLNSYSIFRGTSPQVMSQVGATTDLFAPDPNVLVDTNDYFYTVDDPGQD